MIKLISIPSTLLRTLCIFTVVSLFAFSSNLLATQNASGSWVDKKYSINGNWEVMQREDGNWIIKFDENFKTKSGPDLKVFLSPQSIDEVTGKTATQGAVLLAKLTNNKGAQEYVLPSNIDINDFKSLLIHCEAYSVLWGGANFS